MSGTAEALLPNTAAMESGKHTPLGSSSMLQCTQPQMSSARPSEPPCDGEQIEEHNVITITRWTFHAVLQTISHSTQAPLANKPPSRYLPSGSTSMG